MLAQLIRAIGATRVIAFGVSGALHLGLLACLVAYRPGDPHAHFEIASGGFQIEVQIGDPGGSEAGVLLPDPEPEVIVQPREARIADHRFIQSPTVELPHDVAQEVARLPSVAAPTVPPPDIVSPPSAVDVEMPHVTVAPSPIGRSPSVRVLPGDVTGRGKTPLGEGSGSRAAASPGGHSQRVNFANNAPPIYPTSAVRNRYEGTVLLRIEIGANGRVELVEVAKSSGYEILDEAAVNAVRKWRGKPATSNGKPVATSELLPVQFKL